MRTTENLSRGSNFRSKPASFVMLLLGWFLRGKFNSVTFAPPSFIHFWFSTSQAISKPSTVSEIVKVMRWGGQLRHSLREQRIYSLMYYCCTSCCDLRCAVKFKKAEVDDELVWEHRRTASMHARMYIRTHKRCSEGQTKKIMLPASFCWMRSGIIIKKQKKKTRQSIDLSYNLWINRS